MAGTVVYLVLLFVASNVAQYNDDSDYNDFDFYDNLPSSYERSANENLRASGPDDFYIITDMEGSDAAQTPSNSFVEETPKISKNNDVSRKPLSPSSQGRQHDWYDRSKKIYRYTKHRIPGYDYDELDFLGGRSFQQCDRKSIWSNCVCQFTCYEPNIVDCFTPCRSGCECKEDYVFDETTQQCILPEQCTDVKDYLIYKK